jgi:hypothetical protein
MKRYGVIITNLLTKDETVKLFNTLEEAQEQVNTFNGTASFLGIKDIKVTYFEAKEI